MFYHNRIIIMCVFWEISWYNLPINYIKRKFFFTKFFLFYAIWKIYICFRGWKFISFVSYYHVEMVSRKLISLCSVRNLELLKVIVLYIILSLSEVVTGWVLESFYQINNSIFIPLLYGLMGCLMSLFCALGLNYLDKTAGFIY